MVRNLCSAACQRRLLAAITAAMVAAIPPVAMADARHAIGSPGKPAAVSRTVPVTMRDTAFEPSAITVEPGETVRFVVRNAGELLHEFNIGTQAMHAEHRAQMLRLMESGMITPTGVSAEMTKMDHSGHGDAAPMKHDHPNSVLVAPGGTGELVWTFPRAADLEFACNVPGHYEAGMAGRIRIVREAPAAKREDKP